MAEEGCRLHEQLEEHWFLAQSAGAVAQALYEIDRLEDAETWIERTAELDDVRSRVLALPVRAKLLARRGG